MLTSIIYTPGGDRFMQGSIDSRAWILKQYGATWSEVNKSISTRVYPDKVMELFKGCDTLVVHEVLHEHEKETLTSVGRGHTLGGDAPVEELHKAMLDLSAKKADKERTDQIRSRMNVTALADADIVGPYVQQFLDDCTPKERFRIVFGLGGDNDQAVGKMVEMFRVLGIVKPNAIRPF